jgi:hypothetical protein
MMISYVALFFDKFVDILDVLWLVLEEAEETKKLGSKIIIQRKIEKEGEYCRVLTILWAL